MKLLVLAQTPPPVHGQSIMVRTLLEGLPAHGVEVHHVNLALSRDAADIGRWRPGKILAVLDACFHAVVLRFTAGCDTLYYVPAPAKRGALYRDWVAMLLCRPFFPRLVLHWQAAGLGGWLATKATAPERWLTQLLLGRADLAVVLGESLRADAAVLTPARIAVVRNGIADPCPGFERPAQPAHDFRTAVFLGLIVPEKGVLDAIAAVRLANTAPATASWRLVLAGEIPDSGFAEKVATLISASAGAVRHIGFVKGEAKHRLLSSADALVFPSYYPAETQGLVVAEALAYDLPVVLTGWRAVAENLPTRHIHVVRPRAPAEIGAALRQITQEGPPRGEARRHFLGHYTDGIFLSRLTQMLEAGSFRSGDGTVQAKDGFPARLHQERWRGVWRNAGTSVMARVVAALCMLAQVPLAMGHLGVEGFGVWMAFAGFATLLQIADLGLGISAQNQMAASFGRGDRPAFFRIRRRAGAAISVLALLLGVGLAPLAWSGNWSGWLHVTDSGLAAQLPVAALIALAGFTVNLPLSLAGRVACALQRPWLIPLGSSVASAVQLAAVAIAAQAKANLGVFILIGQLGPVLQNLLVLALTRGGQGWIPVSPKAAAHADLNWRDSFKFFLPQAAATLATCILPITLSLLSGPVAVAQINLLQRIFNPFAQAHLMIIGPLWSAYTEAQARGDFEWIRRSFYFSLRLTVVFLAGCLVAGWLTPWFVAWWLGGHGPALPGVLIALVAGWYIGQLASQPFAFLLGGLNHPTGMAIYGTLSQLLTIAGAWWLGPRYGAIGITAAAALIALGLNLPATAAEALWRFQCAAPTPPAGGSLTPWLRLPPFLRGYLARRLAGPDRSPARHEMKACIFKVDRIGDFVLATGAIRRLLAGHGEENCLLVVSDTVAELAAREFPRTPRVTVPPHAIGLLREIAWIRRAVRPKLGEYHFEQLICLRHQRSLYRDLLLTWIKADRWIGLSAEAPARRSLNLADDFTLPERYPRADGSGCSRDLLAHRLVVAEAMGAAVSPAEIHPRLTVPPGDPGRDVLVFPFSSDPVRNYPASMLAEALGRVRFNGPLVLSGTAAQRPPLEELARLTRAAGASDVQVDTDESSPLALVDRVAHARLVLSMDSAAAHIATALDRPAVIILGGGEWELMSPWGPRRRQRWVFHPLPCFNCSWRCQFDRTLCLTDIPPATVTQAINDVLAQS